MSNLGKQFEERFKLDWLKSFPGSIVTRLYDTQYGSNICDFICYNYPYIYFIECKEHKGASIPFSAISQINRLKSVIGKKGVYAGVVLWLSDKDIVLYIPITTLLKAQENNEKSIGIRHLDKYNMIKVPSKKLRTFMESDYSILVKE